MSVNRSSHPLFSHQHAASDDREKRWFSDHRLLLAAWAWQGFQQQGRGLVLVRATTLQGGPWPWSDEPSQYEPLYLSRAEARPAMDLLTHKRSTQLIHTALETYNPATDLIAVVFFAQQPLVVQLTQMQVPPEEAFRQVKRRRDEFNLS